ncbi:hypothetical protein COOONC_22895 [Cooperia oncophora]
MGMGGLGMGMGGLGMGYGLGSFNLQLFSGVPPMGLGMGLGMGMLNNPYGYGDYYYRCRNLMGGGMYNPLMSPMMGKK